MALLGVLGAASVAVSACGGGDDTGGKGAPPPVPGSAAAGGATAPAAGGNAKVTRPGTRLKIGQRAVLPYRSGSRAGVIGVTVTGIVPGDRGAFAAKFGSRAQGLTPYYIRYTVENVGGTDLSTSSAPLLGAIGPDGRGTGAIVIGSVPGCDRGRPTDAFAGAGAKYQTCRLQAARAGAQVAGAEYDESAGGYDDGPVVWTKS